MSEHVKLNSDELPEGISAALDKLMANPQLINMVASALGGMSAPASSDGGEQAPKESDAAQVSATPAMSLDKILPLIGKLSSTSQKGASFKHEQLLCAIKPYLSPARCQAIDGIIRISKMSDIIGQLKL